MSQSAAAMLSIFALLVPQLSIEIAEFRLEVAKLWKDDVEKVKEGLAVVRSYSWLAIIVAVLVNVGTAVAVALTTQGLDDRMLAIITGFSRLLAAVYTFFISVKIPKWLGVYHSLKSLYGVPIGQCVKVLKFNVMWSIWGHFTKVYFFLILFYNGVTAATIPISAIIGIVVGCVISIGIYLGRTKYKQYKRSIAFVMATLLSLLSSLATASGCIWIQTVWGQDITQNEIILGVVVFVLWLLVQGIFHYIQWKISERMAALQRRVSQKYKTVLFKPGNAILRTLNGSGDEDGDSNESGAAEQDIEKNGAVDERSAKDETNGGNASQPEENGRRHVALEQERKSTKASTSSDQSSDQCDALKETSRTSGEENDELPTYHDAVDAGGAVAEAVNEATSGSDGEHLDVPAPEEFDEDPSYCSLFLDKVCWCCCCRSRSGVSSPAYPQLSTLDRFVQFVKWTLWTALSIFFLFLTIVNIGATAQVDAVNTNLPLTETALYTNMDSGPVCAFNNQGANSTIVTYPSMTVANAAGFTVLHCGACGQCSTWDNLRIEYTTRDQLANMAQACGKLTLFQGYEAAIDCQMNTIGFDRNCSECWVNDEVCARDFCAFIYIQAMFINNVGNFKVAPRTVTSATCEEAMCERVFVPCSGASRRRMDIVSSIARPKDEQCGIVQVNYTQLFA